MTAATDALQGIVNDYRASRDVLGRMLTELQGVVENAKREASLTSDILARIEGAAGKLAQAQIQAEEYLDKIGEVLAEAHQEFGENMRRTLGEANREFYEQLSQATKLLRAGIQELEMSLSTSAVGGNG
jgi:ABC-type transporter Mla subunit MlaD